MCSSSRFVLFSFSQMRDLNECTSHFSGRCDAPCLQSCPATWRVGDGPLEIVLWAITGSLWVCKQVVSESNSLQLSSKAERKGWSAVERQGPAPSFRYRDLGSGWGQQARWVSLSLGSCGNFLMSPLCVSLVEMTWKSMAPSCKGTPSNPAISPEGLQLVEFTEHKELHHWDRLWESRYLC